MVCPCSPIGRTHGHTATHLEELRRLRKLRAAEHAEYQKAALRQAKELERVTEKVGLSGDGCVPAWIVRMDRASD